MLNKHLGSLLFCLTNKTSTRKEEKIHQYFRLSGKREVKADIENAAQISEKRNRGRSREKRN